MAYRWPLSLVARCPSPTVRALFIRGRWTATLRVYHRSGRLPLAASVASLPDDGELPDDRRDVQRKTAEQEQAVQSAQHDSRDRGHPERDERSVDGDRHRGGGSPELRKFRALPCDLPHELQRADSGNDRQCDAGRDE